MDWLEREGAPASSRATTTYRLVGMTKPVTSLLLRDLSPNRCQRLYARYASTHKPATHHGALKESKAWGKWCVKQGWIKTNPWAGVENIGRKSRGKPQHRIDDAAKLYTWLVEHARFDDGACAVLVGLVLGLRASEIVGLKVSDLDDKSRVLWVAKAKTQAGVRPVKLPAPVRDVLLARTESADGPKKPGDRLIPRSRWWVRTQTMRACKLAGVPVVTAHALRGANTTAALEAGDTPEKVAKHLGHADKGKTAREAYAQTGAGLSAHVAKVEERLRQAGKEPASVVPHRPKRVSLTPKGD